MSVPLFGLLLSSTVVAGLFFLFRFERRRGDRFLPQIRGRFDSVVVNITVRLSQRVRFFDRKMIRQTIHYFFHTVLTGALRSLERIEGSLKRALRTNRSIARRLERDPNRPKNKLDAMAEHKQTTALSEEEKKKRKQKSLEGK